MFRYILLEVNILEVNIYIKQVKRKGKYSLVKRGPLRGPLGIVSRSVHKLVLCFNYFMTIISLWALHFCIGHQIFLFKRSPEGPEDLVDETISPLTIRSLGRLKSLCASSQGRIKSSACVH